MLSVYQTDQCLEAASKSECLEALVTATELFMEECDFLRHVLSQKTTLLIGWANR